MTEASQSIQISLCIPTYNRAALLAQALGAITAQADLTAEQRRSVEIVVSDNCSPDDTSAVVACVLAGTEMRVTLFRQPENRGGDANILSAMEMAQGEFVCLLSDDDILLPGALAKLFFLFALHPDADGICLNTKGFVADVSEETALKFRLAADMRYSGRDVCLEFLGTEVTFLSALVFRRSRTRGRTYESRIGTLLLQSYVYLDILAGDPVLVATVEPFLAVRGYNSGGFNFFEVFVTRFHALMEHALTLGFSPQVIRRVEAQHLHLYLTPYAIVLRVRESYGTFQPDFADARRRLCRAYGASPFLWLVTLPALSVPRGLLQAVHGGLKRTKSRLRPRRAGGGAP